MKVHPRYFIVAEAELKLARSVIEIVKQYSLTPLELQSILNIIAASWLKSAIRAEREEETE